MQASGLTDFTAFICTSAIWGQSCFLVHFASCIPQLLSNHPTGWQHPLGQSLGALIHIWRPEIIDGYDISYLLICQDIFKCHIHTHTHTHTHTHIYTYLHMASLAAQMVKNLPVMQETWILSLGWEASMEKGMATLSSILSWRIP